MTTNKLVRLDDVMVILENTMWSTDWYTTTIWLSVVPKINALPTYPEPTKWSNNALLQEYIDMYPYRDDETGMDLHAQHNDFHWCLYDIQSQLTERVEYEIGKEYEFSDDGKNWRTLECFWFLGSIPNWNWSSISYNYIRPIPPISSEELQAIELLERSWYTVSKK
jgi:hypothetical protein